MVKRVLKGWVPGTETESATLRIVADKQSPLYEKKRDCVYDYPEAEYGKAKKATLTIIVEHEDKTNG